MDIGRFTLAALCITTALSSQAFQGEQNPLPPPPFQPMLKRADVRAQSSQPLQIGNGGTGVAAQRGMADRAQVRAGALAVARQGAATYGDTTFPTN